MPNIRVHPPADGLHNSMTVNGRTYTASLGSPIDVPDFDAAILTANGWVALIVGGVGSTALRPALPNKGQMFLDTTVGSEIKFDGLVWRNTTTGAAV